jgi:hypothetical protein
MTTLCQIAFRSGSSTPPERKLTVGRFTARGGTPSPGLPVRAARHAHYHPAPDAKTLFEPLADLDVGDLVKVNVGTTTGFLVPPDRRQERPGTRARNPRADRGTAIRGRVFLHVRAFSLFVPFDTSVNVGERPCSAKAQIIVCLGQIGGDVRVMRKHEVLDFVIAQGHARRDRFAVFRDDHRFSRLFELRQ